MGYKQFLSLLLSFPISCPHFQIAPVFTDSSSALSSSPSLFYFISSFLFPTLSPLFFLQHFLLHQSSHLSSPSSYKFAPLLFSFFFFSFDFSFVFFFSDELRVYLSLILLPFISTLSYYTYQVPLPFSICRKKGRGTTICRYTFLQVCSTSEMFFECCQLPCVLVLRLPGYQLPIVDSKLHHLILFSPSRCSIFFSYFAHFSIFPNLVL